MTDLQPGSGTPRARFKVAALLATFLLAVAAAACAPAAAPPGGTPGSGGATGAPSPVATPTATTALDRPTGATDVVLRISESGGFMPIEHNATSAPWFTLYGDGTVVFRDPYAATPEPINNVIRAIPFMTVKLDERGVDALLQEALGRGGLGVAAGPYGHAGGDIPSTIFAMTVGGTSKSVEVIGLSPDMHSQDRLIVGQLAAFAEKLRGFAGDVAGEQPYAAAGYRGILIPVEQPFGPVVDWPWKDLEPADFVAGANEFWLTRTMTPADVAALGIPDIAGGLLGVALEKDDDIYTFALRPLLPDETA